MRLHVGRASTVGTVLQRSRQHRFLRIAQRMVKIVTDGTTCHANARPTHSIRGAETIGIVAKPCRVFALHLDREISGAAIIGRVETVGFATGRSADKHYFDIDATQSIDQRFAG